MFIFPSVSVTTRGSAIEFMILDKDFLETIVFFKLSAISLNDSAREPSSLPVVALALCSRLPEEIIRVLLTSSLIGFVILRANKNEAIPEIRSATRHNTKPVRIACRLANIRFLSDMPNQKFQGLLFSIILSGTITIFIFSLVVGNLLSLMVSTSISTSSG